MYDFSKAVVPAGSEYIQEPGLYLATITNIELVNDGVKTPALKFTFETAFGSLTDSFYISPNALWRLKYLFETFWPTKKLENVFKNPEEIFNFFKSALLTKPKQLGIKVIAEKVGEKTYKKLPYADFVFADLSEFKERVVKPEDSDYTLFIVIREAVKPQTTETIQPKVEETPSWNAITAESESDDLPF